MDSIEIMEEALRLRLGSETLKLHPRAMAYDQLSQTMIIGYEQNVLIRINIESKQVSLN